MYKAVLSTSELRSGPCVTFGFGFVEQRQVLSALSQIAKHSVDLAEMVVEAEIFPVVLTCLKDKDEYVKKTLLL